VLRVTGTGINSAVRTAVDNVVLVDARHGSLYLERITILVPLAKAFGALIVEHAVKIACGDKLGHQSPRTRLLLDDP
jgi:hypothetical protein